MMKTTKRIGKELATLYTLFIIPYFIITMFPKSWAPNKMFSNVADALTYLFVIYVVVQVGLVWLLVKLKDRSKK